MIVVSVASLLWLAASASAATCTDTWTGEGGDGLWQTGANWSTASMPKATERACIPTGSTVRVTGAGDYQVGSIGGEGSLVITGGELELADATNVSTVGSYTQEAGVLSGAGSLTVSGGFVWSEGVMSGSGTTTIENGVAGGAIDPTISTSVRLDQRKLVNRGSVTLSEGAIALGESATIENTGTFKANAESSYIGYTMLPDTHVTVGTPTFVNKGRLEKTIGAMGTSPLDIHVTNEGVIAARVGTLEFRESASWAAGSTVEGSVAVGSSGSVTAEGVVHGENASISVGGSGTLNLASGAALTANSYTQSGGVLSGAGSLAVLTGFAWSEGIMSGAGTTTIESGVAAGAIAPPYYVDVRLDQRKLVNRGSVTLSEGAIALGESAVIENTGTFKVNAESSYLGYAIFPDTKVTVGTPTFLNKGTLEKNSGATGTTHLDISVSNKGVIAARLGTLEFIETELREASVWAAGSTVEGSVAVGYGGSINAEGAVHGENASISVGGSGTLSLTSGATMTVKSYTQSGGVLSGAGSLTVLTGFVWSEGIMSGSGTTTIEGGVAAGVIAPSSYVYVRLDQRKLVNHGSVTLSEGAIALGESATLENTGTFKANAESSYIGDTLLPDTKVTVGTPTVLNKGIVEKTVGTGTSTVDIAFSNEGLTSAQTGSLAFAGGGASGRIATGYWTAKSGSKDVLTAGSFVFAPEVNLEAVTNSGATVTKTSTSGAPAGQIGWLAGAAGTVTITGFGAPRGSGFASATVEVLKAAAKEWQTVCSAVKPSATGGFSCSWPTSGGAYADGSYEVRALLSDNSKTAKTAYATSVKTLVDNTAPTGSLTVPGFMYGTRTITGTATDAGSGMATWTLQRAPEGSSTWTNVCSTETPTSPGNYGCEVETAKIADGKYQLRASLTDKLGNTSTTAASLTAIDNSAGSSTLNSLSTYVRGKLALEGTGVDEAHGVASWTPQLRAVGTSSWTNACAPQTKAISGAKYGCTDETIPADGEYELRAVTVDKLGGEFTSATVTTTADNTPPEGFLAALPETIDGSAFPLGGYAFDLTSGVAGWQLQVAPATGETWENACSEQPGSGIAFAGYYECIINTTLLSSGKHRFRAVVKDKAGNSYTTASLATNVENAAPKATVKPVISGQDHNGATLTATTGSWSGSGPIGYTYQWKRCNAKGEHCTVVGGAVGAGYPLTNADVEGTLLVVVTATNASGSASESSVMTGVIASKVVNLTLPKVTGALQELNTATADVGTWEGLNPIAYGEQWERCNAEGASCTNITGATHANYTMQAADVGSTLRVAVTATDASSNATATSEASPKVLAAASTGVRYAYDEAGRLASVTEASQGGAGYQWDPNGNLLSVTKTASTTLAILAVSPGHGKAGETVELSGTDFATKASEETVTFNGTTATVQSTAATRIVVTVPTGATTGVIKVTIAGKAVSSPASFTIEGGPAVPTVTEATPAVVRASSTLTIAGTHMEGTSAPTLTIGGVFTAPPEGSATSRTVKVPPAAVSGPVVLTTEHGIAHGPTVYVVPPSISPTEVTATGTLESGVNTKVSFAKSENYGVVVFAARSNTSISTVIKSWAMSGGGGVTYSLYNPVGKKVQESEFIGNGPTSYKPSITGTYTLILHPTAGETGSFEMSVSEPPAPATARVTPSNLGATTTLAIAKPGQEGEVSFFGTEGQTIDAIESLAKLTTEATSLTLIAPSGAIVGETIRHSSGAAAFYPPTVLPETGDYRLQVTPLLEATGTAEVTVYSVPADVVKSAAINGESVTTDMETPGQRAHVEFPLTSEDTIKIKFKGIPTDGAFVTVKGPLGETVYGTAGLSPPEMTISGLVLKTSGTYKIELESIGAAGANAGTANLTIGIWDKSGKEPLLRRAPAPTGALTTQSGFDSSQLQPAAAVSPHVSGAIGVTTSMASYRSPYPARWTPQPANRRDENWQTGRAPSPWTQLPALTAPSDTTALAGQALEIDGLPLSHVGVSIKGSGVHAETDSTGRFILPGAPAGHQVLLIDGRGADGRGLRYGSFAVAVELPGGRMTRLGYPVWMTPLEAGGSQSIAAAEHHEVVLRNPQIPGLQIRLPRGTTARDAAGRAIKSLNLSAVPVDRAPFPLPFKNVPAYFTLQPGDAYLSKGARVIYPNWGHMPPGQRVEFWNYDPNGRGWYVYGKGSVNASGTEVVPDPGVRIWEFTGAMIAAGVGGSAPPPPTAPPPFGGASGADPIDLSTGLFVYQKTDLELPDASMPTALSRTYRPGDPTSYSFGIGTAGIMDTRLWAYEHNLSSAELIIPDGASIKLKPTSEQVDGYPVFETITVAGPFQGAKMYWNRAEEAWELHLTNGTVYVLQMYAGLIAIRDPNGNQITFIHEDGNAGPVTEIRSPHGRWIHLTYDKYNRVTEAVDNAGQKVSYRYDSVGRLAEVTDPLNNITHYAYNSANEMTSITDARGNAILTNEYNSHGQVVAQTIAGQGTTKVSYKTNSEGKILENTVTDPSKHKTETTFNPTTELATTEHGGGETLSYSREENGAIKTATNLRESISYKRNGVGQVTEMTRQATGATPLSWHYTYTGPFTRLTAETDPENKTARYQYDERGNLTGATTPSGHRTAFGLDNTGEPTSITNPEGDTTQLVYAGGQQIETTDPLGRTTSDYDNGAGLPVAVKDPSGRFTLHTYDADNNLLSTTDPAGDTTSFTYDPDNDLLSVTDPRKHVEKATYNSADKLATWTNSLEQATTYSYDESGYVKSITDPKGEATTYKRDEQGRLAEVSYGVNKAGEATSTVAYSYNEANELASLTDSRAGKYTMIYDPYGRLASETGPQGKVEYLYNKDSQRESLSVNGTLAAKYTYNADGEPTAITGPTGNVAFAYDAAGRRIATTLPNNDTENYSYDLASQLAGITYNNPSGKEIAGLQYTHDPLGRVTNVTGSAARTNLPTALTSATYDAMNELTERGSEKLKYDADGHLTTEGSATYGWNDRGQLTTVTQGTKTWTYAYDPLGRRTKKTLSGGSETSYLYDGQNVAAEAVGGSTTGEMLNGLGLDERYARKTSGGTGTYLTEELGSTIALANSEGNIATEYTYDPFGNATSKGTTSENPFQFTGREADGNGLQDNRARYYQPASGRFISRDPAGMAGSGVNLYQYGAGDPTNLSDQSGLDPGGPEPKPGCPEAPPPVREERPGWVEVMKILGCGAQRIEWIKLLGDSHLNYTQLLTQAGMGAAKGAALAGTVAGGVVLAGAFAAGTVVSGGVLAAAVGAAALEGASSGAGAGLLVEFLKQEGASTVSQLTGIGFNIFDTVVTPIQILGVVVPALSGEPPITFP